MSELKRGDTVPGECYRFVSQLNNHASRLQVIRPILRLLLPTSTNKLCEGSTNTVREG